MSAIALFRAFEDYDIRWNGNLDQPEWIAQDVAAVLGIEWDAHNLDNYDEDEKSRVTIPTLGGEQELLTATEPGLYRLVFRSRKLKAKQFRRWMFHEVLPAIRKTGSYGTHLSASSMQQIQSVLCDLKAMVQMLMDDRAAPKPLFSEAEIRRYNRREMYWAGIPGTASHENWESVRRMFDYQDVGEQEVGKGKLKPIDTVLGKLWNLKPKG